MIFMSLHKVHNVGRCYLGVEENKTMKEEKERLIFSRDR